MSQFNFDEIINRKGTNSIKWDHLDDAFGNSDLLPLWVADMDFKSPPAILEAMKEVAEHGVYGYVKPKSDYFDAVRGWMKRQFDWNVEAEWIHFVPGIVPAIALAVNTFTEPGDGVIIQQPVYHPFINVTKDAGRQVINNRLIEMEDGYVIDFEDLEQKAAKPEAKMMILCSPHNPVGRVWRKEELQRIVEICDRHDILLISDEIHQDLVYSGHEHTPIAKLGTETSKIVTCTAPSKTFNIAGLFASNIIISNAQVGKTFAEALEKMHLMPSPFAIRGVIAAYEEGEPWLKALMAYLTDNVDFVEAYLKKHLPKVRFFRPGATFLLWLDFREYAFTADELERIITEEAQLALNKGWMFGKEGAGHMRLNIGCPRDILKEALDRLAQALNRNE